MKTETAVLRRAWEKLVKIAPHKYERCTLSDVSILLVAETKPLTAMEIAARTGSHSAHVRKRIDILLDASLIKRVGTRKSITKDAFLYQTVKPSTFRAKKIVQINAANPFGLTPQLIAERNRYLEEAA